MLLAASATVFAFTLSWGRERETVTARERYVCPMHPDVSSGAPGECPICRMALERARTSKPDASTPVPSAVVHSQGHGGAPRGAAAQYACPMHPEVTANAADRCPICRMALVPVQPPQAHEAPAAPSQWFTLEESTSFGDDQVIGVAKRRVFALEVRAPAHVEADGSVLAVLYKDDLAGLEPDAHALFFGASAPSAGVDVKRTTEPPQAWDTSTSQLRFRIDPRLPEGKPLGARQALAPGEVGWLKLAAQPREVLVIPSGAVLYSPQGPYVLVAGADGRTFSKRRVEIGKISRGLSVVLSGLHAEEPIAVGSAFSLDAEQRLQSDRKQTPEVLP